MQYLPLNGIISDTEIALNTWIKTIQVNIAIPMSILIFSNC